MNVRVCVVSDTGIIIPLKERIRDLETINEAHQKKNGQLRQEIQDKDKLIKELQEKLNNPLNKMREQGEI
jgi:predicted RNase H-like nuclease (RuvC/YqgF family)